MLTKRVLIGSAALLLSTAMATPSLAQDKPVIRWGYLLPPIAQMASIFMAKPELLKHHGKTYTFEAKYLRGTPFIVAALAAGEIDVANVGYSSFYQSVVNASMTDMKIIGDESEDGFAGKFSSQVRVRKDSGINTIADLKGKIIGTNALGSPVDMLIRYTLRQKAGFEVNRDYTFLETAFPTMKPMLLERKLDAGFFPQPFASDPEVQEHTKPLFTAMDSLGPMMANFVGARGAFISKHRAEMVDFLEDWLRVVRWYYNPANRDASIKIISESTKVPEPVLGRYLFTDQDNYRNLDGLPDLQAIQKNWIAMRELGLIRQELNVNDHVDLSLMKEAAARLK